MENRKCYNCGKTGHMKRDCPTAGPKYEHVMKNIKCFGCGRHGHYLKDCPTSTTSETSSGACGSTHSGMSRKQIVYPECGTKFIDTHCHLEYVFERMRHTGTFEDFKSRNNFPRLFEGCVTTFCDPAAFSGFGLWEELLSQNGVWGTFGCHPHNAQYYNETLELKIIQCLEHTKSVALGEIGLDYSKRAQSKPEIQQEVFAKQARWAVTLGKPIVVHCRDAENDTLSILKESVPVDWKIHMHCFTGSCTSAMKFLQSFKNLYIGITGVVTFSKASDSHELAFDVPLDRLLIETDAPYFVPTDIASNHKWSHPGMVLFIAKKIAEIKKLPIDEVLEAVRNNTKAMYGI